MAERQQRTTDQPTPKDSFTADPSARGRRAGLARSHQTGFDVVGVSKQPPDGSLLLSLQRTAGNAATTAFVGGYRPGGRGGTSVEGRRIVVQRNVLSHVAPDDPHFWNNLKGQVKSDYGLWLGEFDRTFRGFVSVMGQTSSVKDMFFESVVENWVSVGTGLEGALAKAFLASVRLMVTNKSSKTSTTLGDLEKSTIAALNQLTEKVRNTDSDLPIYQEIDHRATAEQKQPNAAGQQAADRLSARDELAQSLEHLPHPAQIEQDLTMKWIKSSDADNPKSPITIVCDIEYNMRKEPWKYLGFEPPWLCGPGNMRTAQNVVEALTDGYGAAQALTGLDVRIWLRVIEYTKVADSDPDDSVARYRTLLGVWVKEGGSWKQEAVLGQHGPEEGKRRMNWVMEDWTGGGPKTPTLADLGTSDRNSESLGDLYVEP